MEEDSTYKTGSNKESDNYIRKSPRVPVTIVIEESGQTLPLSFAVNISSSGMLIEFPLLGNPPEINTLFKLRFSLPFGKSAIITKACVRSVRKEKDFSGKPITLAGIEFVALDATAQEEIANYVSRYLNARKEQVDEIKTEKAAENFDSRPLKHYHDLAKKVVTLKEPPEAADEREIWQSLSRITVNEKTLLRGENPNLELPPDHPEALAVMTNAVVLYLKIDLESKRLRANLEQQGKNADTIFENFTRVIFFESETCIEGLQQIHAHSVATDNSDLKVICVSLRERLSSAVNKLKSFQSGATQKGDQEVRKNLDGPWGKIYSIDYYHQMFADYFSKRLDNPIAAGEIKRFVDQLHPMIQKVISGAVQDPGWDAVNKAILLTYKLADEVDRLRGIKGQHIEHLETIREIFRQNATLVTEYHQPLRNLFVPPDDQKPTSEQIDKRAAVENASDFLMEAYSQYSDFANQLIPGAVAIGEENIHYAKGAFRAAIKKKAKDVKKWVIKRQRRLVWATVVFALLATAFHLKEHLIWKKPVDLGDLQPPFKLIESYQIEGEFIGTVTRNEWLQHERPKRQALTVEFLGQLKKKQYRGLRLYDEKQAPLVSSAYLGKDVSLSFAIIAEDNAGGTIETSGR